MELPLLQLSDHPQSSCGIGVEAPLLVVGDLAGVVCTVGSAAVAVVALSASLLAGTPFVEIAAFTAMAAAAARATSVGLRGLRLLLRLPEAHIILRFSRRSASFLSVAAPMESSPSNPVCTVVVACGVVAVAASTTGIGEAASVAAGCVPVVVSGAGNAGKVVEDRFSSLDAPVPRKS